MATKLANILLYTVDYVFLSIFCFPIFFYLVSRHHVRMSTTLASLVSPTTIDFRSTIVGSLEGGFY